MTLTTRVNQGVMSKGDALTTYTKVKSINGGLEE